MQLACDARLLFFSILTTLTHTQLFSMFDSLYEDLFRKQIHVAAEAYPLYHLAPELRKPFSGSPLKETGLQVRVLLKTLNGTDECIIKSETQLVVYNPQHERPYFVKPPVELFFKNDGVCLTLNGKFLKRETLCVQPLSDTDPFFIDGVPFKGSVFLVPYAQGWYLINQVPVEDYVCAVLHKESWPGWPIEVNKAFAIASRSYVLAKMCEKGVRNRPFHIKNTNIHQTYSGHCDKQQLAKAVQETAGLIVTHAGKPIVAMFDSCCGGIIPAYLEDVDFEKAPYLKRTTSCTFCKKTKLFNWQLSLTVEDMIKALHKKGYTTITDIQDLTIKRKDKAGAAKQIIVRSRRSTAELSGKEFYGLFPQIKSFCYSVKKIGKQIQLSGKGYGHHLGICQWGAREMVNRGWAFDRILRYFYPGTLLMKIA